MPAELPPGRVVAADAGTDPGEGERRAGGHARRVPAVANLEPEPPLPRGGASERDKNHKRAAQGVEGEPHAGIQRPQGSHSPRTPHELKPRRCETIPCPCLVEAGQPGQRLVLRRLSQSSFWGSQ